MSKKIKGIIISAVSVIICIIAFITGNYISDRDIEDNNKTTAAPSYSYSIQTVPDYSGKPYVVLDGNIPEFKKSEVTTSSYESYGKLDSLGRCTECEACVGRDLMPEGERESISEVKPTGWKSTRYDFIDGENLYNRCHLIAYMLTAENANERNLITGTRYLNTEGMLPFEESVCEYVKSTGNHVMYRVTPVFSGNELVARGVQIEALSVEDKGKGISFNVYCYNVQPKIEIDYKTGKNKLKESNNGKSETYILNTNNLKFHKPSCKSVKEMNEKNKKTFKGNREDLIAGGYSPCGECNP